MDLSIHEGWLGWNGYIYSSAAVVALLHSAKNALAHIAYHIGV